MASKGGRKYARDSRGRFSSTGGKGVSTSGTSNPRGTIAKSSVTRSIQATRGAAGGTLVKPAKKAGPSVAERKKALVRDISAKALSGKKGSASKAQMGYVRAQQAESRRLNGPQGKGSKAARRMKKG